MADGGDDPVGLHDAQGNPTYIRPIDPAQRRLNDLGLYSHAADAVQKLPQMKGTPQQFKAMLLKQGVKPDEFKWSNYDTAMAGRKLVTKDELAAHFNRSLPKINERRYSDNDYYDYANDTGATGRPKYKDYTLPGGENYRELTLHLPKETRPAYRVQLPNGRIDSSHPTKEAAQTRSTQLPGSFVFLGKEPLDAYKSSHWDEPNVLAHLRLSDRPFPGVTETRAGNATQIDRNKALHLEELQSDWAQEGRQKGFKDPVRDSQRLAELQAKLRQGTATTAEADEAVRLGTQGGIPHAPYVDSTAKWTDLGLKRALLEAAKGGYHKLVVTPGEEQAKRYDLSKHISKVTARRRSNNDYLEIFAHDHAGKQLHYGNHEPNELPNVVGKDLADKIVNDLKPGTDATRAYSGLDLRVGGEGMKAYYDRILPQALEKLAKKHDPEAKVQLHGHTIANTGGVSGHDVMNALGIPGEQQDRHWRGLRSQQRDELIAQHRAKHVHKLHSLDITPKMRASILKGQPAYAEGGRVGLKDGGTPELEPGALEPDAAEDPNYQAPSLKSLVRRGQPLNPRTPKPTPQQLAAARADTRTGGDIVNQRLNTIVPEHERVAGGSYTPGAPGGGRWADATIAKHYHEPKNQSDPFRITDPHEMVPTTRHEKLVDQPGHGFKSLHDDDLDKLWHHAVAESSLAAKQAVAKHGVHPTFSAKDWHEAMGLPLKDHLWYELSGEKMAENLPDLTPHEHMKMLDVLGATSARAKPDENLERTLATMSQHLRGHPVDVDLTQPAAVTQALSRKHHDTSALPGNKTGHFSDTLALAGGVPTRFPISVNDVWVGKMFGVPDDVMTQNQSLHEPMAKYFNKLRDLYNQRHGHELPFKYQSWNFQAPAWVHLRNQQSGASSGDAYHQVWGKTIKKLRDAGVQGLEGDKITRRALMDPRFADALRRQAKGFRDAPKATVEFGTTQTPVGKQAHELYHQALERGDKLSQHEYLKGLTTAMYASARGKDHPWDQLKKAITGNLSSSDITRIMAPTSEAPMDVGGTFEGAVSPNIRVPLKDMNDQHLAEFNAIAGRHLRQDAMAVSHILGAEQNSEPREGYTRGHSIFVPTTDQIHPDQIRAFAKELAPHGHNMSYVRYPNGYHFDVLPAFGDEGPKGVDKHLLDDAYGKTLKHNYGTAMVVPHDFKSVYTEASDYGKTRAGLTKRIRDEYVEQSGLPRASALKALEAPEGDLSGRGKKARDVYRARLGHLAGAEQGFKELAQKVAGAHSTFIEKATKRLSKPEKPRDPDAPPFAAGGAVVDNDVVGKALALVDRAKQAPAEPEATPEPEQKNDQLATAVAELVKVVGSQDKTIKQLIEVLMSPQIVERDENQRVKSIKRERKN